MNIFLIYAIATAAITNSLAALIILFKPNHLTKLLVWICAVLNLSAIFWIFAYGSSSSSYVMSIFTIFISANILRYGSGRLSSKESRASIYLNSALLLVGISLIAFLELNIVEALSFSLLLDIIIGLSFVASLLAAVNIIRTILTSRVYRSPHLSEEQKPTVTVAIAARNEDHALEECIDAVLSSDYPKMEVLVLDDCSSDGTSGITRLYAQNGVRFIPGQEPPLGWLGQNWSYQALAQQAAGQYIIFLGADVRISPQTISRMVQFAKFHTYSMISVQPMMMHLDFLPQLLQPLRLLWQTTFRNLLKRPPVSSGLWLIDRDKLEDLGSFKSLPAVVNPEKVFAAKLYKKEDYFYAFANADDGVIVRKKLSSLWDSAIRSYYPHLGKNPALVCYMVLLILAVLFMPALNLIDAILSRQLTTGLIMGIASSIIWWISHMIIVTRVSPSAWFLGAINLPIMAAVEIYLSLASFYKYEFGKVIWKSRNICWLNKEQQIKLEALRKIQPE